MARNPLLDRSQRSLRYYRRRTLKSRIIKLLDVSSYQGFFYNHTRGYTKLPAARFSSNSSTAPGALTFKERCQNRIDTWRWRWLEFHYGTQNHESIYMAQGTIALRDLREAAKVIATPQRGYFPEVALQNHYEVALAKLKNQHPTWAAALLSGSVVLSGWREQLESINIFSLIGWYAPDTRYLKQPVESFKGTIARGICPRSYVVIVPTEELFINSLVGDSQAGLVVPDIPKVKQENIVSKFTAMTDDAMLQNSVTRSLRILAERIHEVEGDGKS